jgi:hypothetical protein
MHTPAGCPALKRRQSPQTVLMASWTSVVQMASSQRSFALSFRLSLTIFSSCASRTPSPSIFTITPFPFALPFHSLAAPSSWLSFPSFLLFVSYTTFSPCQKKPHSRFGLPNLSLLMNPSISNSHSRRCCLEPSHPPCCCPLPPSYAPRPRHGPTA